MEAIQQARKLYLKCHHHQASLTDEDKKQLAESIQRFITIAIKEATAKDLFENNWMLDILKSALKNVENSDLTPVARAFQSLEKYIILLVEQPWKPEFKEIKMYGGFYRTRIKSVLPDCQVVFQYAGYVEHPGSCTMIFQGPMNKNFLLLLAFDCMIAQVECETIAERYNKGKALSMTMSDAISNTLHDGYSRNKPNKFHLTEDNGIIVNRSVAYVAPPALPKREPILNSLVRPNVKYESENVYNGNMHNVAYNRLDYGINEIPVTPKSPNRTSDFYSAVVSRPPLTPSGVVTESLTYIDDSTDEILPELLEGTSEDHMRESLKHVKLQDNPKQLSSFTKDNRSTAGPYQSNFATQTSYAINSLHSGGGFTQTNSKSGLSYDEGIEQDLSNSKSYTHSARYSSNGGQLVLPNKQATSYQHISYDQGYRTGVNPDSMCNPMSASCIYNSAKTIYHPPAIVTDGAGSSSRSTPFILSQIAVPPPIPSRALKPKSIKEEGAQFLSAPHYTASQLAGMSLSQGEVMTSRSPMSAPGYSVTPMSYNTEPVLRRERLALAKTSSLGVGGNTAPLSQQIAAARSAHSMDITSWVCKICTTMNISSNMVCSACSESKHSQNRVASQPIYGNTFRFQVCSKCTYNNKPNSTNCEMCAVKLCDKFSQGSV